MRRVILIWPLLWLAFNATGQEMPRSIGGFREKMILITETPLQIDSLSVIPGQVYIYINDSLISDTSLYKLDHGAATLTWNSESIQLYFAHNDSALIRYRVFPVLFTKPYQHREFIESQRDKSGNSRPWQQSTPENEQGIFQFEGLSKSGSISRGITLGSNQDVVVNSSMNLQLSGRLNERIEILAALTDENIPIQPDGNTQQLQEFDKVFIQISSGDSRLIAGDYDLTRPESYFMNFYKKAQGLNFMSKYKVTDKPAAGEMKSHVSFSSSKGKQARNLFNGTEGNQGPYRLKGNNNELFIIILAGTERVFVDGKLIERGQENEYVMDYNSAEITFTPKLLITKDSRISIEFEYTDRNYARSLLYFGQEYHNKKLKLQLNTYSEQDNRNQPLQQNLNDDKKRILSLAGDNPLAGIYPGADSTGYIEGQLLYALRDTISGTDTLAVYVFSTHPDSALYRVSFSLTGQGKGNYKPVSNAANGRVFQWIAPITGIPQGSYEPIILLVAPKKQQLATLSSVYSLGKKSKVELELAVSNNDLNLYSELDNVDNTGFAFQMALKDNRKFLYRNSDSLKVWVLNSKISIERAESKFNFIERYRSVEFARDWNLQPVLSRENELLTDVNVGMNNIKSGLINYTFKTYQRGNSFDGILNGIQTHLTRSGFKLVSSSSFLTNQGELLGSTFGRIKSDLSKTTRIVTFGFREELEQNKQTMTGDTALSKSSFYFFDWSGYIKSSQEKKIQYGLEYGHRIDYAPQENAFLYSSLAKNAQSTFEFKPKAGQRLAIHAQYRQLTVSDTSLSLQKDASTLVSRIEYSAVALKGGLSSNTYYELGTGQEPRKEFTYVEVSPGTGLFSWTDYNGNGIRELNEFEVAAFPDQARFIRVFLPSIEYVRIVITQFNHVIHVTPSAFLKNTTKFSKVARRFTLLSLSRIDTRNIGDDFKEALNPFRGNTHDSVLVALSSSFRNTLFFNRGHPVFGTDVTGLLNSGKTLLSNGIESRNLRSLSNNLRWNFTSQLGFQIGSELGEKENLSGFFSSRNYRITYFFFDPVLSFQPSSRIRMSIGFKHTEKNNVEDKEIETAILDKLTAELRHNTTKQGSITVKGGFVNSDYNSEQNNAIAFEMLEGFSQGLSKTWGIVIQRTLVSGLQINLNYEGRKTTGSSAIQTGNVQVRAYF